MSKKYKLTDRKIQHRGRTLYQIQALGFFGLSPFGEGDLGGYVESESNLSQAGKCWICSNCKVFDDAYVFGNARISGEFVEIFDNAYVFGNARVVHRAQVFGNANVYDNAEVVSNARVYGTAQVFERAWITDHAHVSGNARISGDAFIMGSTHVSGDAHIRWNIWSSHYSGLIKPNWKKEGF